MRRCPALGFVSLLAVLAWCAVASAGLGDSRQEREAAGLLDKADKLYQLREHVQSVQMYQNVITLYASTKYVYTAHLRLGHHFQNERKYNDAITHYTKVAEGSADPKEVAEALLATGECYNLQESYGKSFTVLREVTERFAGSDYANRAYLLIGEGHFALKNYKRAIEAYNMVGTGVPKNDPNMRKLSPGKRLFVRVQDADLRMLARLRQPVTVVVKAVSGDSQEVQLAPMGGKSSEFIGWAPTALGTPIPNNGILEVLGHDEVAIDYIDQHTADGKPNVERLHKVTMASDAQVAFTDGAYLHKVQGVALGRAANVRVVDFDASTGPEQNQVKVAARVKRLVPPTDEEKAAALEQGKDLEPKYAEIDHVELTLKERPTSAEAYHSGIFVGFVNVRESEPNPKDNDLQVQKKDIIEVEYLDERRLSDDEAKTVADRAEVVEGSLEPMTAFDPHIRNEGLRYRTELAVAGTLLDMGRIYKDLGLQEQANRKLDEALAEAAKVAGGKAAENRELYEQCQFLLWRIYYERGDLGRAQQVCMNLLHKFPDSPYVDDALLTMAQTSESQGNFSAAIGSYQRLLQVKDSPLRPDAQYHIALCYEQMKRYEQALEAYQKCADTFPDSKFAGESIVKIARFYYRTKDYVRAVEIFKRAERDYRDSDFFDSILISYGRALLAMGNNAEAEHKFRQLIAEIPGSQYLAQAKELAEKARTSTATGAVEGGFGE